MLPTNQEEKRIIHHVQERYANVQSKYKNSSMRSTQFILKSSAQFSPVNFELNEKRQLKKLLSFIHSLFPKNISI